MTALVRSRKNHRPRRPKPPQTTGAWQLWRTSVSDMRAQWRSFAAILAIVAVPLNLMSLFDTLAHDPSVNAFSQVAAIIMNVALIWAIVEYERTGTIPRAGDAYHEGSSAIVRYLLAASLLVVMLVPAAFAGALYLAGFLITAESGSVAEQAILIGACLLIASLSGWWVVRFGLGPTIAVAEHARPLAALRHSRRLTMGRFWKVAGRYGALVLLIALTALPIALVTAGLSFLKLGPVALVFFGLATTLTALPLLNLYLLKLYRSLEYEQPAASAEEASQPEPAAEPAAEPVAEPIR